jgi:hypothetical protein
VERIAAALVPWIDASTLTENDALATGPDGRIIRSPAERSNPSLATPTPASNPRSAREEATTAQDEGWGAKGGRHHGGAASGSGGGSAGGSTGGGTSGGSTSGGDSSGAGGGGTNPVDDDAVGDVQGTVGTVADEASGTVDGVTGTVGDVVDSTGIEQTVDGLASELGK